VRAGGQVTAVGISVTKTDPVLDRLDALDGPVLASFTPKSGSLSLQFQGPVTVPAETKPGTHLLLFTQYDARQYPCLSDADPRPAEGDHPR